MIDHANSSIHTRISGASRGGTSGGGTSGGGSRDVTHSGAVRRSCAPGLALTPLPAHDSRIIQPSTLCSCAFNHAPLLLCRFTTGH